MDSQSVKDLAELLAKQVLFDWKIYLWIILLSFIGGGLGSFISSYFKMRGKNFATKADFDQVLEQLTKTTEAAEQIKTSIAHENWKAREQWVFKRQIYKELLEALSLIRFTLLKLALSFKQGKNIVSGDNPINELLSAVEAIQKCEALAGMVLGKDRLIRIKQIRDAMAKVSNITDAGVDVVEAVKALSRDIRSIEVEIVEDAKNELMSPG